MPSPFPGMDPYLEEPTEWRDVHHELISCIRAQLADRLQPRYVVRIEERVYIEPEDDPARPQVRIPDLYVIRKRSARRASAGSTSVVSAPVETTTIGDSELNEARLLVKDPKTGTVIT